MTLGLAHIIAKIQKKKNLKIKRYISERNKWDTNKDELRKWDRDYDAILLHKNGKKTLHISMLSYDQSSTKMVHKNNGH